MKIVSLATLICCFGLISEAKGQKEYPPHIDGAKEVTYKTVDTTKLNLWIFNPEKHKSTDTAPAIVFFFGGGWSAGSPTQFVKHCEYLSARGMVAIVADYRVKAGMAFLPKIVYRMPNQQFVGFARMLRNLV